MVVTVPRLSRQKPVSQESSAGLEVAQVLPVVPSVPTARRVVVASIGHDTQ